jgi:hypothetical protein
MKLLLVVLFTTLALAQPDQRDRTIDAKMRAEVIDGAIERLKRAYVFPEVAEKMGTALRDRQSKAEYDSITSARAFANKLTSDLQDVSHDKHLRVGFFYEPQPERSNAPPTAKQLEEMRANMAFNNFGFEKVERLAGNIGYIDFRAFMSPNFAADTATAAMNFVSNSDALIIDLRGNGGGDPAMVALISTYLFDDRVHLNDIYWRPSNETNQWWTLPHVPGKRLGTSKEVYVLTSRRTFSAAEEFTYNLKNLKRATIVGETTGGGAHPGGFHRINDHFGIGVPSGRAINPISKTNWEGTGVHPDVECPADRALKTAHLLALKKITEKTERPELKQRFERVIGDLQREIDEMKAKAKTEP